MSILSSSSLIFLPFALSTLISSTRELFYCYKVLIRISADYTPPGLEAEPDVPLKGLVDDLFIF
jgi:hypothetical protein